MTYYPDICLYIGGEWLGGDGEPVLNPYNDEQLGVVPHVSRTQLDRAIDAAAEGLAVWKRTSPARRAQIMMTAAALLRERTDTLAAALTLEQGKIFSQARTEVARASDIIEWDTAEGRRLYGRVIPTEEGLRNTVLRQPIGVVAAFSPWNFPMASPTRKVSGALAAGCSIVLKASEETPAGAVELVRAFHDAGLPPGVLNLVFGVPAEISEYLIPHPDVRLVAFTGSTAVGKQLAGLAAKSVKPAIMELGGHAPVIVAEDTDPALVGAVSARGKARNSGQICVSPTRYYVHESIFEPFTAAFAEQAARLPVGDGFDPASQMGPLANRRRLEAMEMFVEDATSKGARLLQGGRRVGNLGNAFPLTVLADLPDNARAMVEEPFGPLALINPVASLEEAILRSNSLPFGLAAYAFTNSAQTVDTIAQSVEVGHLSINHYGASTAETPFGGVKESGYGREGGLEGLEAYTSVKNVSHRMSVQ